MRHFQAGDAGANRLIRIRALVAVKGAFGAGVTP
jgi:hypothetical protein